MPQNKLYLLDVAAGLPAELRASPAQIMGAEMLDPNLLSRLLDDRPDRPITQAIFTQATSLPYRPEQPTLMVTCLRLRGPVVKMADSSGEK
jgi:hypothetical protein